MPIIDLVRIEPGAEDRPTIYNQEARTPYSVKAAMSYYEKTNQTVERLTLDARMFTDPICVVFDVLLYFKPKVMEVTMPFYVESRITLFPECEWTSDTTLVIREGAEIKLQEMSRI